MLEPGPDKADMAYVGVVQLVMERGHCGAGGPHPLQIGVLVSIFPDAMVRRLEPLKKPASRIPYPAVRVHLFDGLNRDAAGFLAAFQVSAHAIRRNSAPALHREFQGV